MPGILLYLNIHTIVSDKVDGCTKNAMELEQFEKFGVSDFDGFSEGKKG